MKTDGSDWKEKVRNIENGHYSYNSQSKNKKRLSIILKNISEEITFHDTEDSINDFELYINLVETLADKNYRKEFFDTLKAIQEEIKNSPCTPENMELQQRIKNIITSPVPQQEELFNYFDIQKNIELKKDFALNFGSIQRIEKVYKKLLKKRLSSGRTLKEHLEDVKNWFNNLHGIDLGNWLKIFAFAKSVKEHPAKENLIDFVEVSTGRFRILIMADSNFYKHFIKPDKNSGFYTTKAKDKFLKWLFVNQTAITFPFIFDGEVWAAPMKIYEYAETIDDDGKKKLLFIIDTNILDSEFKDYISINIDEIDFISDLWEEQNLEEFTKYRLVNFIDIPLKFLLTLKTIYSRKGEFKAPSGYKGVIQKLTRDNLDEHLGGLNERLRKHLIKIKAIRPQADDKKTDETRKILLNSVFDIAVKRGWLMTLPIVNDNVFTFNMNSGYFDRRRTAQRLTGPENH